MERIQQEALALSVRPHEGSILGARSKVLKRHGHQASVLHDFARLVTYQRSRNGLPPAWVDEQRQVERGRC